MLRNLKNIYMECVQIDSKYEDIVRQFRRVVTPLPDGRHLNAAGSELLRKGCAP